MTHAFTIILPHRRNPGNDAALTICLDCIARNTRNDFALIMDAAVDSPLYPRINRMIESAYTDCVVYMASDMFLCPNWDVPMLEAWTPDTIVTNVVVEPGAIAMHHMNLHRDFGRKPSTFQREAFETWAANDAPMLEGQGWYCPYMISRTAFLNQGGFATDLKPDEMGFSGADQLFFAEWESAGGSIVRAKSFVYHLQRWSDEGEQVHEKRG